MQRLGALLPLVPAQAARLIVSSKPYQQESFSINNSLPGISATRSACQKKTSAQSLQRL
jgi:hypothetical protein